MFIINQTRLGGGVILFPAFLRNDKRGEQKRDTEQGGGYDAVLCEMPMIDLCRSSRTTVAVLRRCCVTNAIV